MSHYTELPPAALSAYSDLLTALLRAPISAKGVCYITRTVKGRKYWYLQYVVGASKKSHYLGPDSEDLQNLIAAAKAKAAEDKDDRSVRERLVATGVAAGLATVSMAEARVYEALVQSGLLEAGATLVGTHAFICLGNQLGVSWNTAMRTEDIDVGHDPRILLATRNYKKDLGEELRKADRGFFAVPAFDRNKPSTHFRIRGKQLSVSILTPAIGKAEDKPVILPHLNLAAEPVRFLDYLIEDAQLAAVPHGAGLLVRIPNAGRFAIHKIVVSQRRPVTYASKSRKDILQAAALFDCLREMRPGDIRLAAEAASKMPRRFLTQVRQGISALPEEQRAWIKEIVF